jgi:hypothetical protein
MVLQEAPQLEPTMEFGMLGNGKFHYRYKTGRELIRETAKASWGI